MNEPRLHAPLFAGTAVISVPASDDVDIEAHASARELHVREQPDARLRTTGAPDRIEHRIRWRRHLPPHIEGGQTYRDIEIHRHVGARVRDPGTESR